MLVWLRLQLGCSWTLLWGHARAGGHYIGDVLLSQIHLLHTVSGKEARVIGAAHIALQESAVGAADHFDDIAGLQSNVAHCIACIWFHADHSGAGVSNRAGSRVRVGAHARGIANDVAGVTQRFICGELHKWKLNFRQGEFTLIHHSWTKWEHHNNNNKYTQDGDFMRRTNALKVNQERKELERRNEGESKRKQEAQEATWIRTEGERRMHL